MDTQDQRCAAALLDLSKLFRGHETGVGSTDNCLGIDESMYAAGPSLSEMAFDLDMGVSLAGYASSLGVAPNQTPCHANYVNGDVVAAIVALVPKITENGPECLEFARIMEEEFETHANSGVVLKLVLSNNALLIMAHILCQDRRCADTIGVTMSSTIVEPTLFSDELIPGSGVTRMLRPGRCFKVNDPLAFNLVFRALQRSHISWPTRGRTARGTKGITDALDHVGLGPGTNVRSWNVKAYNLRGPSSTDPNLVHPDGLQPLRRDGTSYRQTDGLYYREYMFSLRRGEMAGARQKHGTCPVVITPPGISLPVVPHPMSTL